MQFPFKNPCELYDTSKIGGELSTYNEWIETQLEQETVNHSNLHISDPSLISLPQESSTPIEQLEMNCGSQDDNRLNESPTTETMESTITQPPELTQSHDTNQNGAQNSSLPSNNSDDQFTSSNRPEAELSRTHNMVTRAQRGITKPNPRYAYLHKEIPREPKTVISALKNDGWKVAMHEELHALKINDTWDLVPREAHMNVVGCKWVFKTKLKPDGNLDCLKARLVAKGFHQIEGFDFLETFSLVVKPASIHIVITTSCMKGWTIRQLNVKNAFLHGYLSKPVYMKQPPGFIDSMHPSHVCRLKKALCGLKQAPRAWFDRLNNFFLNFGFFCSITDPSLFICHSSQGTLLLLIYVDDMLLTGDNSNLVQWFLKELGREFAIKDLGSIHYFLGIEAHMTKNGLFLCQAKYAKDLLHRAQMDGCKLISTPMATKDRAITDDKLFHDPTFYRSVVGGLQYLTLTHPDNSYAVNFACQFMHEPTMGHFRIVKRILRYINGYCTFLGGNCISWCAKKQPTVSLSSAEAEYKSMASTIAKITWLTYLLRDIGIDIPNPPILHCDNITALHMTINPVFHGRTKHVEMDYHFVREKVAFGNLVTRYVSSSSQLADIFTKRLPRTSFNELRTKLGLSLLPRPSLRGSVKAFDKYQRSSGLNAIRDSRQYDSSKASSLNVVHDSSKAFDYQNHSKSELINSSKNPAINLQDNRKMQSTIKASNQ
ncbi:hypothetical protein SLEP1_g35253 [Rubroshorea leprosula]|uniref:Reverse transcriptase Ty1/copia-type domain-containing protein n=1 Tax=Rubroshorea leprosula TaxID=152421 RepID=A0AAV5KMK9_9ROSI|nr:hypothetical protein SLEP1_g35253 [Rubroshorea leprosula]